MTERFGTVAVVGAGAFGTALALVAARAGAEVVLYARDPEHAAAMRAARENARHMRGVPLPGLIRPTADGGALAAAELVLLAVPAQASRAAAAAAAPYLPAGVPVLACAKGIERDTGALQTDILRDCLPACRAAALSGPGFADEIARGMPTALTVTAADLDLAHRICAALSSSVFRLYSNDDLIGVELGGAAKNVLAIACGIVAGRGMGESARAALISRGLAEMMRLGVALGARRETFMGLSGLGDLVLTATSGRSRNTTFGMALGQGRTVADLLAAGMPLAEGAHTAAITADLARQHTVEVPIITAVAAIIDGHLSVDQAVDDLVRRPLKAENA